MLKQLYILILIIFFHLSLSAQDLTHVKKIISTLSSPAMHGRGYVFKGDSLAADYIKSEMSLSGLKTFKNNYFQRFNMSVNTLPGALSLKINGNELKPDIDYLVYTPSMGIKGKFRTVIINSNTKQKKINKMLKKGLGNKVLVIDNSQKPENKNELFDNAKFYNLFNAKATITLVDKKSPLSWSVYGSHLLIDFTSLEVNTKSLKRPPRKVELNIENEYFKEYHTQNVIGYIEGTKYPDSFFVFTAHYDHLGRMGKETLFPGAHDNASGTATMLDLTDYYKKNPPEYSIAFMAMAGEEAGLLGSKFYTENPLFPLKNIKFLINLDMLSTGEEGMMVVNGEVYTDEFSALKKINDENKYLPEIKSRGEAANSDHYNFYKKGVKSFYFYTLGGYSQYHNILDIPETLPFPAYDNMFHLITAFIDHLSKNTN